MSAALPEAPWTRRIAPRSSPSRRPVEHMDRAAPDLDPRADRRIARLDAARLERGEARRAKPIRIRRTKSDVTPDQGLARAEPHSACPATSALSLSAASSAVFQCGAIVSTRS